MNKTTVEKLPSATVKLLTSSQVITSVSTAVKELLENSIDAGGKIIQVRLENYGLDLIEVKDNGFGVSYDNVQRMFLPGYTSKIKQFEDLDTLNTYGFRGEALAAICKLSKVSISTKTATDTLAMTYNIDENGVPLSSKPTHLNNGTSITITNLFSNLPVRKSYLSVKKRLADDLKKTEQIVQCLSLIHPELNVSLIHNKCIVWKKNSVKGLKQSFMQVASLKTVSKMDHISKLINNINIELIVPKKNLENVNDIFTNSSNGIYVYVNKRPVTCSELSQPIQEHIFYHYSKLNLTYKYAIMLLSVEMPSQEIDVNLEPNKTKILLKNKMYLINCIDEILSNYYNNGNFHCTALIEDLVNESFTVNNTNEKSQLDDDDGGGGGGDDDDDEFSEKRQTKKLKLDLNEITEPFTKKINNNNSSNTESVNKENKWTVEIIDEETNLQSSKINENDKDSITIEENTGSMSLCSQINKENCVLTTDDEVLELNSVLNETNFRMITSANSKNCITRLIERNDLQSQFSEGKILPEWPKRESSSNVVNTSADLFPTEEDANVIEEEKICNVENEEETSKSKTVEEIIKEIETDAEKWSRDIMRTMKKNTDGEEKTFENESNDVENISDFNKSIQNISSRMGKKEMKAFTKFARIMRPKILNEYPKLIFTQVANLLAERWKALSPAEVKNYEKIPDVVVAADYGNKIIKEESEMKENVGDKGGVLNSDKLNDKIIKNENLKLLFEKIKSKNKIKRPPRSENAFPTSIKKIKDLAKNIFLYENKSNENDDDYYEVIGQLRPSGNWLYVKGTEIGHIRHCGLNEMIIHQKMLSNASVPRIILKKPILITEEILGDVLWRALMSLTLENCTDTESMICHITDDVIIKNGFEIKLEKNEKNSYSRGYITEVASTIPHYGISDLKDVLVLLLKNGEVAGLANLRPTSVVNYFTSESIRSSQQMPIPDLNEIKEMLNTYHLCLRHLPPICLHNKEIFSPVYKIQ